MIERSDINGVLSQIRQARSQFKPENIISQNVQGLNQTQKVSNSQFSDMLSQAVEQVNSTQKHSSDLAARFEHGDTKVDLPDVMIAAQKASVSFQAMNEVRNKLVNAYQDIMNMPV